MIDFKFTLLLFFSIFQVSWAFSEALHPERLECRFQGKPLPAQILDSKAFYPESPLYTSNGSQDHLYYVEYSKDRVSQLHLLSKKHQDKKLLKTTFWSKKGCGPASITSLSPSSFLVACYDENTVIEISSQGKTLKTLKPSPSQTWQGPNDFTHDTQGGIYFTASGVFDVKAPIQGKILYLSPQFQLTVVAQNIHYSNGIVMEPEGKFLLVAEHLKNRILKYSVLSPGRLSSNPEVFADLNTLTPKTQDHSSGYLGPDGMRLSPHQTLYVAQYGGSRLLELNLSGAYLRQILIESPYRNVTNLSSDGNQIWISLLENSAYKSYPGKIIHLQNLPKKDMPGDITCTLY